MRDGSGAQAAHFNQAGYSLRRARDDAIVGGFQEHLIVRNQRGEATAGPPCVQKRLGKRALARSRATNDHDAAVAHDDHGCVNIPGRGAHDSAGKAATKRAPLMSPGFVPGIFSALSVPPWASTICLLIDRPRPEF